MYIALYKNGCYYKKRVENGHLIEENNVEERFAEFKDVCTRISFRIVITEEILKNLDIPNLGYIKTKDGIQVFDTTLETYTEEMLPVYVDVFGSIKKSKKWISFKVPTKEAIEASYRIYEQIEKKLCENKSIDDRKFLNKLIEEGNGIAYIDTIENSIYNFLNVLYNENIKVLFSYGHCHVIGGVAKKPVLDLYVPKTMVPMIIGKGGNKIKSIAAGVNAKRINVKEV